MRKVGLIVLAFFMMVTVFFGTVSAKEQLGLTTPPPTGEYGLAVFRFQHH